MRRFVMSFLAVTLAACGGGGGGGGKNDLCAKKVCTDDRVCDPSDGFCKLRNGGTGGGSSGTGGGTATGGGDVGTGGGIATGGGTATGGGDVGTGGGIATGGGTATGGGDVGTGGGIATGGGIGTGGGIATGGGIGTGGGIATGGGVGTGGGITTDGGDLGIVGTACNTDNDCFKDSSGLTCRHRTMPGDAGYTDGYCTRSCSTQNACNGIDAFCFGIPPEYGETQPLCVALCDSAQDCRVGYTCYDIGAARGACWLDPLPPVADAGGFDAGPPPNTVGNACVQTSQCQNPPSSGVFCYPEQIDNGDGGTEYSGFTGGYCMRDCTSGLDCSTNGSAACITGLSDTYDLCAQLCTYKTDGGSTGCRGNYACQPLQNLDGGLSPQGYCWTRCDDPVWGGCAQGQTCLANGACR